MNSRKSLSKHRMSGVEEDKVNSSRRTEFTSHRASL